MEPLQKGKSPFYPGQPVPIELFTGRSNLIERLITRGISQVRSGKPIAMYIQGEYGIGKTSIANFVKWIAEAKHNLYGIYATLGGATKLDDVGEAILRATVQSGALDPRIADRFKDLIGKYVGDQSFYGLNIHLATLKADAPSIAHGALPFLRQILDRLSPDGVKGIMLILDEINGIASNPAFAHFLKSLGKESRTTFPGCLRDGGKTKGTDSATRTGRTHF
jgi:Cdc6-like AAA superfamily ATPase